jgi:hypothetical protein
MKPSRSTRFVTALITLFSVLYMQFAVAGYNCPGHKTEPTVAMSTGSDIAHMADCEGMDKVQPNLCQAHDQVGNQSLDKPNVPPVQSFVAAGLALTLLPIEAAYRSLPEKSEHLQLTRSTAPPLSIQNCCFRI